MNYLLFSFLKTLYFCYNSMVFLSIYNILYTIGKLWFPSFQWDCCQSEILTYFLSSQLSILISYLSPVQLVLFKILEYSRQCKIPHSKAYALLLRTDNQESCSATLGPHLYFPCISSFPQPYILDISCLPGAQTEKYRSGPRVAGHDSWDGSSASLLSADEA